MFKNFLFIYIFFLINVNVFALTLVKMSSDKLVNKADFVVQGKITNISYQRKAYKNNEVIVTTYVFSVNPDGRLFVNSAKSLSNIFELNVIGGIIGNESLDVPGLYKLKLEQEYVLFLNKKENNLSITNANQGVYFVTTDKVTNQKLVVPYNQYAKTLEDAHYINANSINLNNNFLEHTLLLNSFITNVKLIKKGT
jgi:hypothetical protein